MSQYSFQLSLQWMKFELQLQNGNNNNNNNNQPLKVTKGNMS